MKLRCGGTLQTSPQRREWERSVMHYTPRGWPEWQPRRASDPRPLPEDCECLTEEEWLSHIEDPELRRRA